MKPITGVRQDVKDKVFMLVFKVKRTRELVIKFTYGKQCNICIILRLETFNLYKNELI